MSPAVPQPGTPEWPKGEEGKQLWVTSVGKGWAGIPRAEQGSPSPGSSCDRSPSAVGLARRHRHGVAQRAAVTELSDEGLPASCQNNCISLEWKSLLLTLALLVVSKHPLSLAGGQAVPTQGLSSALPRGYLCTWKTLGAGAGPSPSSLFFRWRIFHLKDDNFLSTTSEWWLLPEFSQIPLWFVHHMDISVYSTTLTGKARIRENSNNVMCATMGSIQHNTALGILIHKMREVIFFLALEHVEQRQYRGSDALKIFTV